MDVEKLTGVLHLPLGESLERELRNIAKANGVTPQTLFRWAAEAIVQCQAEFKRIPRDMRLVGAPWPPSIYPLPSPGNPSLNEAPEPKNPRSKTPSMGKPADIIPEKVREDQSRSLDRGEDPPADKASHSGGR